MSLPTYSISVFVLADDEMFSIFFLLFKGESFSGVHKSELIAWYLSEMESQIENEQQLNEQNLMIEKIINRLINYVSLAFFFMM